MAQLEEVKTTKKSKKKWFVIGGIFLVLSFSYSLGNGAAKTEIDGTKVNYEGVLAKIEEKEKELSGIEKDMESTKAEFDRAKEVIADKESAMKEVEEIKYDLSLKHTELKALDELIAEREATLLTLDGKIKEKGIEPITLSAGQYFVGTDFPIGRYKAVPNGGGGNLFVYSAEGDLMVNTMIGSGKHYESEYIFFATEGAYLEATTSIKLIAVE
jgi:hypothetical protein